ncbi:FixH family protein [Paenibacillus sp. PL2-23]|uniref:FixH family protein n=1 Tax=Paenibacillus sp. PL2-23 TaxID=2100729 RepID=UPI0030F72AA0
MLGFKYKGLIATGSISLLLLASLSACTAKTPEGTDEKGLHPHVTIDMRMPDRFQVGVDSAFTVEVKKNGELVTGAEYAEFLFWPDGHKDDAIAVPAVESSPGIYSAPYAAPEEGIYVVQTKVQSGDDLIMPAKRFAIGTHAVEQLIQLEEAQQSGEAAPEAGGHHHH